MGVSFFPCDVCGESICDCGMYYHCSCGRRWCSKDCALDDGYIDESTFDYECDDAKAEPDTCKFCRGEDVDTIELLAYALTRLGLTRQELVAEYNENCPVPKDE